MMAREQIQPLSSPWDATFSNLVATATSQLLILSPYITRRPIEKVLRILKQHHRNDVVHLRVVTDLSPSSLASQSLDTGALLLLLEQLPQTSLTHLPGLHAKVYVADQVCAVITSANMTDGGLLHNYEFGVYINDPALVARVREDAEAYAELGSYVSRDDLADLNVTADELASLWRKTERYLKAKFRKALREKTQLAQLKLLRVRAKGKTTHGIFADTLMYLLLRGPQRTVDLHRMIQRIHPDLCDDSINRVIDGVHFGKKWKHHVRTAQQYLKRTGMITYDKGRWYRTDKSTN